MWQCNNCLKWGTYMTENELILSEYSSYYEIKQHVNDFLPIIERIKVNCSLLGKMTGKDPSMTGSDLALLVRVLRHKVWDIKQNREYIINAIEMLSSNYNTLYASIVKNCSRDDAIAAKLLLSILEDNIEKIKSELS